MSKDRFLERVRSEAQQLRYEPSDVAMTRMSARIRARVAAAPTASQLLANWMRPLTVSLGALAVAASLGVAWYEAQESVTTEATIAQTNLETEMARYSYGD